MLSFAMTLFFCASLAMLVRIDQTCGGFDGAETGTLLVFSPGENQVKVTLLSQEHTVSLAGARTLRALWWKLYPLMPYPVKLGETLRETLFARMETPPETEQPPEEPPEEIPPEEPQEPQGPPATSWDTMPAPKEDSPQPEEEQTRETDYAPLFSPEELALLEEQREEAQRALEAEDDPENAEEAGEPAETGEAEE